MEKGEEVKLQRGHAMDVSALIECAAHAETPAEILEELASHEDESVRAAVALNPSTPLGILELLRNDGSPWVRDCLMKRAEQASANASIHPTAIIHEGAVLGRGVSVGPYTIIHPNVLVGDDTFIGSHCEIGHPVHRSEDAGLLTIGKSSHIRSHSVFYEGSTFGDHLITGHRVTVREKTRAGRNFQIGTLGDIQGHCDIGDFVRLHSNVHIGQHARIKDYVWLFPYVVLTNDPHPPSEIMEGVTIEEFVAIATMSVVLPGVTVMQGALVGAHSLVSRNVDANTVVAGSPAKFICETSKIKLKNGSNQSAYPWRRHFHRGYLPETVSAWMAEFAGKA